MFEMFKEMLDKLWYDFINAIHENKIVINNGDVILRDDCENPSITAIIDTNAIIEKHNKLLAIDDE